ncbi:hypothetical protein MBLNU459_g3566t1 [Dothideomycetes sp. NU459]
METYEFESIVDRKPRLFRLFKLRAGLHDDDIEGEIKLYRLRYGQGSRSDCDVPDPDAYDALSYHWGPRDPDHDPLIRIVQDDGKITRIQVTKSLFSALKQLRNRKDDVQLWIDALCINQKDAVEKSSQISYMSTIYNQAECVRIWLGEYDAAIPIAFDFIKRCLDAEVLDKMMEDTNASRSWDALSSLMRKPWFSRRWIVQEIALARKATLHCGDETVTWGEFADVVSQLSEKQDKLRDLFVKSPDFKHHPDHLGDISELGAIRLVDATDELFHKSADGLIEEKKLTLEEVICSTSAFEASDPHDVIYAVLSLANDAHGFSAFIEAEVSTPLLQSPSIPNIGTGRNFNDGTSRLENSPHLLPISLPSKRPHSADQSGTNSSSKRVVRVEAVNPSIQLTVPDSPEGNIRASRDTNGISAHEDSATANQDSGIFLADLVSSPVSESQRSPAPTLTIIADNTQMLSAPEPLRQRSFSNARDATERTLAAIATWKDSVKKNRFRLDYNLSIFQVCKELLIFTITRSKSLDILCRPWAPDDPNDPEFPSWISLKDKVAFEANDLGVYRRVNADPLLGKPEPGGAAYQADRSRNLAHHRFYPAGHERERSLTVRGFVLESIGAKDILRSATSGTIPSDWKRTAGWDGRTLPPGPFWRTLVGDRTARGRRAPSYWRRACQDAFRRGPRNHDLETSNAVMHDVPSSTREFVHRLRCVIWNRRLVNISKPETGLSFCLVPEGVHPGDLVCILYGCNVPVILREATRDNRVVYQLIGECYVHGAMDGEATRIRAKVLKDRKATREEPGQNVTEAFDQLFELK